MQLYVSFSLLTFPNQKHLCSAKSRNGSGTNSPYWLYTQANVGSGSLCAMTTVWHFHAAMLADIMNHFNVVFCTSFISNHLNNEAVSENRTQQTPAFAHNFAQTFTDLGKPSARLDEELATNQQSDWNIIYHAGDNENNLLHCQCNHKIQCELGWTDSRMQPLPHIRSYTETNNFFFCRKNAEISEKCYLVSTVLLTSQSILVSLVHVSTDIRYGQWETLSNKTAERQNDTSVQLEKSFIISSGSWDQFSKSRTEPNPLSCPAI